MKNKVLIGFTAIVIIIAICVVVFIPKNKKESKTTTASINNTVTNNKTSQTKIIDATLDDNGDLRIDLDDLESSNATFINYKYDGTSIELIAIINNQNNIDVAFNTCQVCNGAPKAYFIQKNGKLVCENCGNSFSLKTIGASANGCNPMTIQDSNIIKTDTGIIINKEYLIQNEKLFINVAEH